jgi:HD-GYP domain-containing protein (c-di-GMP phosphodiesterase class II)
MIDMLQHNSDRTQNLIIFTVLSILIILGLTYAQTHQAAAIFFPAAGVYTAFYYLYRKNVLPGILSAIWITNLAFRLVVSDEAIYISVLLSTLFLLSNIIEMVVFSTLLDRFKVTFETELNANELGKYFLTVLTVSFIGAIIGVAAVSIFYFADVSLTSLLMWVTGSATGILVFGSLIINTTLHDTKVKDNLYKWPWVIVYIIIYVSIVYATLFDMGTNNFSFQDFQIVLVLLYIIASFKFSFRMIAVNNLILIILLDIVLLSTVSPEDYVMESVNIILFLIIVSSISSVVRILILEREDNYLQMKKAKDNLEKVIVATNDLFKIENAVPEESQEFSRNYLNNMFDIACDMYPIFDKASCNMKHGKYVEFIAVRGYDKEHLNSLNFLEKEFVWTLSHPDIIRTTDYDVIFEDQKNTDDFIQHYGNLRESIRFTVKISDTEYAGMSFDHFMDSDNRFTKQDVENFASFQTLMNSYYKIGVLATEKNQLKDDIVLSLVRTLELYDLYTGGHSEQVAELSALVAVELGLSADEVREIYWAGIVHDIGKIGLPEHILNKQGKLTKEEYEVVKKHPQYGYDILARSDSLEHIADIVLHHHEWYNGKGYPAGLQKEDIPYHARILHVCDAVDSMAQDRVYRKKLTDEQIIDELVFGMGLQFDPKVAKVMIAFIKAGKLQAFVKKQQKSTF